MVLDAEEKGYLRPGGTIVEGTSGSTGISLAQVALQSGYKCIVVMPNDQALEKRELLKSFHAKLLLTEPSAIVSPQHYVNIAKKLGKKERVCVCLVDVNCLRR